MSKHHAPHNDTPDAPHIAPRAARPRLAMLCGALILSVGWMPSAPVGATDISNQPLIHAQGSKQPNLMFLLDNSGSMARDYMPENTGDRAKYSVWSWHCNGAAFNPSPNVPDIYKLPKTHDGRDYPQMSIGAAWEDGFQIDLSNVTSYAITPSVDTDKLAEGTAQDVSFVIANKPFLTNDVVVLVDPSDTTHWLTGTVTSVSTQVTGSGSRKTTQSTYLVHLTFTSVRNGTLSNWSVAKPPVTNLLSTGNSPATHYYYKHSSSDSETAKTTEPTRPWKYTSSGALDTSDSFVSECLSDTSPGISAFTQQLVSALDADGQKRYANWYSYYRTRILMMRSAAGLAMNDVEPRFRVGFSALNKNGSFNTDASDVLGSFASVNGFDATQRRIFFSNLYGAPVGGTTPLRRALAKIGQYYGNRLTGQTDPIISACQRNYSVVTTDGYWNESTNPTKLDGISAIDNQDDDESLTPRPEYDGSRNYSSVEQRTNYDGSSGVSSGCTSGKKKYTSFTETRPVTTTPSGTTYGAWARVSGSNATTTCKSSVPTATSAVQISSTGGPAPNTLADVAEYYFKTDLRSDLANNVAVATNDANKFQHMVTFTLGLGLSGRMNYAPGYQGGGSDGSSDYNAIIAKTANWPIPPLDSSDDPAKIDDLWHAAVNGHGRYFSASSSSVLTSSLQSAFNDIKAELGAGSSAASTSLRPVLGTDQVFVASYQTVLWNGELQSFTISTEGQGDAQKVVLVPKTGVDWRASDHLATRAYDSRHIYYMRHATSSTYTLGNFDWTTLSSDQDGTALTGYFNNFCSKTFKPTQCDHLTTYDRINASGANLLNFLRGDKSKEATLYRSRNDANNGNKHNVLGDMVDASPVYVGKPPFSYTGQGYPDWKESMKARCPVVYAAANDGMLHAFSARTATSDDSCVTAGQELWAYIPRAVMPEMYRLADANYAARHVFTVNGSPVVADVSYLDGSDRVWRSILVGGLGAGGKAYYALDVTNPSSPTPLWEFTSNTDADLGLTFGNPVVTQVHDKNGDLTWAVVFTSGMNNGGNGYLFVVEALTGKLMYKVPTLLNGKDAVGSSSEPSGLNKLNAWVVTPSDNEAQYFYSVDLKGNVWRFDANNLSAPSPTATTDTRSVRLAQLKKNGTPQPITVKPELAEVKDEGGNAHKVVLIGTGQYLGDSDAEDLSTPWTVYAIKDPLGSTGWSDARSAMVGQTLSAVKTREQIDAQGVSIKVDYRELSKNKVDWSSATMAGWYVDLPIAGERVAVGMNLAYSTLTVASLVPTSGDDCNSGGESWLYDFNIQDGSYVDAPSIPMIGGYKSDSAVMGINTLQYEGRDKSGQIITHSDGTTSTRDHVTAPTTSGSPRRTAWRELTQ
jgi:type IV pilus assembly protein PilY1